MRKKCKIAPFPPNAAERASYDLCLLWLCVQASKQFLRAGPSKRAATQKLPVDHLHPSDIKNIKRIEYFSYIFRNCIIIALILQIFNDRICIPLDTTGSGDSSEKCYQLYENTIQYFSAIHFYQIYIIAFKMQSSIISQISNKYLFPNKGSE